MRDSNHQSRFSDRLGGDDYSHEERTGGRARGVGRATKPARSRSTSVKSKKAIKRRPSSRETYMRLFQLLDDAAYRGNLTQAAYHAKVRAALRQGQLSTADARYLLYSKLFGKLPEGRRSGGFGFTDDPRGCGTTSVSCTTAAQNKGNASIAAALQACGTDKNCMQAQRIKIRGQQDVEEGECQEKYTLCRNAIWCDDYNKACEDAGHPGCGARYSSCLDRVLNQGLSPKFWDKEGGGVRHAGQSHQSQKESDVYVKRSDGRVTTGTLIPSADRRYLSADQEKQGYVLVRTGGYGPTDEMIRRARWGESVWPCSSSLSSSSLSASLSDLRFGGVGQGRGNGKGKGRTLPPLTTYLEPLRKRETQLKRAWARQHPKLASILRRWKQDDTRRYVQGKPTRARTKQEQAAIDSWSRFLKADRTYSRQSSQVFQLGRAHRARIAQGRDPITGQYV